MQHLKKIAEKYAAASANIIIEGESGTGKELFAQSIHNSSTFRTGPFVAVNCAALSESLLESELFGYEEGAFTGAKRGGKPGLFELAHNGTIFLDEIGDMPCSLQSRLLRVIQEKEVIRIGGSRVIPVNNRFVCATNKNLLQEVEKGNFRQDLYYRINILQVRIPSLRDRAEDIPQIAQVLFSKACKEMKKKISMQPTYLEMLKEYHWPGNVRELEAFVERLLSITAESRVEYEDFISCFDNIKNKTHCPSTSTVSLGEPQMESGKLQISLGNIKTMEDEIIRQVLRYANGDKDRVEKILGISKTTLWRKTKDFPEIACVR